MCLCNWKRRKSSKDKIKVLKIFILCVQAVTDEQLQAGEALAYECAAKFGVNAEEMKTIKTNVKEKDVKNVRFQVC